MVKKKSKYKHISINKKQYYFYKITWLDIFGDSGHRDFDSLSKMKPATKITYAFLFKKDYKTLHTFSTFDEKEEEFSDCNVFPIGCIKNLKKIEI